MSDTQALRNELLELIGKNPSSHNDPEVVNEFTEKLKAYAEAPGVDKANDVMFAIGASVFGVDITASPSQTSENSKDIPAEKPLIVDFDYMKKFIKDVFLSYGCTEEQAEISSDV